jgi:exopolysaccharide biosynthesis polyprenyl glycosylphosphotransferase
MGSMNKEQVLPELNLALGSLSGWKQQRPARFDAAARVEGLRLCLRLMHAATMALAVLVVLRLAGPTPGPWSTPARLALCLLPLFCGLLPARTYHRLGDEPLARILSLIAQALQAALALACLQLMLWLLNLPFLTVFGVAGIYLGYLALSALGRAALCRLDKRWQRRLRLVVVGVGEQGLAMADHLARHEPLAEVVGFVDDRRDRIRTSNLCAPFWGGTRELLQRRQELDGVIIALPNDAGTRVEHLVQQLRMHLPQVYLAPEMAVLRQSLARTPRRGLQGVWSLGLERLPLGARLVKRLFDIVVSVVALTLFLPLGLVISALIKWESPGPVIFTQQRFGLSNHLFRVFKFRSMTHDPARQRKAIELTQRGDARVTRIGDFLRRTSLDEFPQFANVLLGHMSVVGPRPHPPGVKAGERTYEEVVQDFLERYKVRPGITGWAQVNGLRGNTFTEADLIHRFEHDVQYIRHWSLELDVWIVLKTMLGGFGGRNAF